MPKQSLTYKVIGIDRMGLYKQATNCDKVYFVAVVVKDFFALE